MTWTDIEARVVHDIASYGWHVIKVRECDDGPGFAFTIGLWESYRHPELVMVGLDLELMHAVLNDRGLGIKAGVRFEPGQLLDDVLEDYTCAVVDFPHDAYDAYLGSAVRHYGASSFPALQIVWPDTQHNFPWDAGATFLYRRAQPVPGRSRRA